MKPSAVEIRFYDGGGRLLGSADESPAVVPVDCETFQVVQTVAVAPGSGPLVWETSRAARMLPRRGECVGAR